LAWQFLEFNAEIWENNKDDGRKHKAVKPTKKNYSPFLDTKMYWSLEGNLQFKVHVKENHSEACFQRLTSLTTRMDKSELSNENG
jgi:hypothetical protein